MKVIRKFNLPLLEIDLMLHFFFVVFSLVQFSIGWINLLVLIKKMVLKEREASAYLNFVYFCVEIQEETDKELDKSKKRLHLFVHVINVKRGHTSDQVVLQKKRQIKIRRNLRNSRKKGKNTNITWEDNNIESS